MTIQELSRYHAITIEIEQITKNLKELENTVISSKELNGMPKALNITGSSVESLLLKKEKLENLLNEKKELLLDEHLKIENFLKTVQDDNIRIIIRSRFIDGKNWHDIAKSLNFDRTTPYYQLKKYLESIKDEIVQD